VEVANGAVTYGDDDDVAVSDVRRGEETTPSSRSAAVPMDHLGKMMRGSTVVIVEVLVFVIIVEKPSSARALAAKSAGSVAPMAGNGLAEPAVRINLTRGDDTTGERQKAR